MYELSSLCLFIVLWLCMYVLPLICLQGFCQCIHIHAVPKLWLPKWSQHIIWPCNCGAAFLTGCLHSVTDPHTCYISDVYTTQPLSYWGNNSKIKTSPSTHGRKVLWHKLNNNLMISGVTFKHIHHLKMVV